MSSQAKVWTPKIALSI